MGEIRSEQFSQIPYDDLGSVRLQLLCVTLSVDADHEAESASRTCLYSRNRVLDHNRRLRAHSQHLRRPQEGIRGRLACQTFARHDQTIHASIEQIVYACGLQNGATVLARSHNGGLDTSTPEISK